MMILSGGKLRSQYLFSSVTKKESCKAAKYIDESVPYFRLLAGMLNLSCLHTTDADWKQKWGQATLTSEGFLQIFPYYFIQKCNLPQAC